MAAVFNKYNCAWWWSSCQLSLLYSGLPSMVSFLYCACVDRFDTNKHHILGFWLTNTKKESSSIWIKKIKIPHKSQIEISNRLPRIEIKQLVHSKNIHANNTV